MNRSLSDWTAAPNLEVALLPLTSGLWPDADGALSPFAMLLHCTNVQLVRLLNQEGALNPCFNDCRQDSLTSSIGAQAQAPVSEPSGICCYVPSLLYTALA